MNKKIFFIVLVFLSCTVLAQNEPNRDNGIIEKTTQKYNALAAFSMDYTFKVDDPAIKFPTYKGTLIVQKEKYYLSVEDQIIGNDGKMLWNYQKSTNEASFFGADDDSFSMFNPMILLNNWSKDYKAKFIRKEVFQKKSCLLVDLTPVKQFQFYKIRLFIDENTYYVKKIMMFDMDNSTTTYTITKFNPNVLVPEGKFTFNKSDYPGVQVNDMR
jgi:outer membrane lipoprotein-sorting protein